MIRLCSVSNLRFKFNIDISFSEMRRLYWIKSINAYPHTHTHTHTHRKEESGRVGKCSWKELWKFQVYETNFVSVFLVKYVYECMKFLMYEDSLWQLKPVSTIFIFTIKIKLLKNHQKCLLFYQKVSACPRDFQVFGNSFFPSFSLS